MRLRLKSHDIVPDGTLAEWHDGSNITEVETLRDGVVYYYGYVEGLEGNSNVAISLDGDEMFGFILKNDEGITVEPVAEAKNGQLLLTSCGRVTPPPGEMERNSTNFRSRRAPSSGYRKYLEVLVAADTTVVSFVGKDRIKRYLLTMMNIVNTVYHHDSLGVNIEVVTVKIMYMDQTSERSVVAPNNPQRTVDQFCQWMSSNTYRTSYSEPGAHHDVAVLLTRNNFNTAGYAPITGLCLPMRNCALVKDDGFTSAFVIAHEVAHVFGLMHDGHGNTCYGQAYTTSIMATVVQSSFNSYWWSGCSKSKMKEVIGNLPCLNNNPHTVVKEELKMPLGMSWSLDEQCRFEFGEHSRHCIYFSGIDPCAQMWCTDVERRYSCKTKKVVPLDGTQCGNSPEWYCQQGACGYHGNQKAVDGGWSQWSSWSDCSAVCDVGFKRRSRACDSPMPQYQGKNCEGEPEDSDTCYAKECTEYSDQRAIQCSMMDVVPVGGQMFKWRPYQVKEVENQCKLTCIAEETNEIVTFDTLVENGTPCSYERSNLYCLDGECEKVGCDGVRGSDATQDRCGICQGDNSTCKVVSGTYVKKFQYGAAGGEHYDVVLVLPKGSRNITISETATSPHFLALQDTLYYNYALNGDGKQSPSRDFVLEGALFHYQNNRGHETITTKGPIHRDINLLVYAMDWQQPARINYAYTVDKDDFTLEKNKYKWRYMDWTPCSVTCGKGVQHIIYGCFDRDTDEKVDDNECEHVGKNPAEDVPCEAVDCNAVLYMWRMLRNFSECSATCGTTGARHRLYECERRSDGLTIGPEFCAFIPAPTDEEPCNRVDCIDSKYKWHVTSEWSACSATCGDSGTQHQLFYCEKEFSDGRVIKVNERFCSDIKSPKESRACNREPCVKYTWEVTDTWLECNESCGDYGVQLRKLVCMKQKDGESSAVGILYCAGQEKPEELRQCNRRNCYTYQWFLTDEWSECSHSCGDRGLKERKVMCKNVTYDNREASVDPIYCDNSKKPSVREECNILQCEAFYWKPTYEWTECSSVCGDSGYQTRIFTCHSNNTDDLVDDFNCKILPTAATKRPCNQVPCSHYEWRLQAHWTPPCASSCSEEYIEVQEEVAYCIQVFAGGQEERADGSFCINKTRPLSIRGCEKLQCSRFVWKSSGKWTDCGAPCGEVGVQTEIIKCTQEDGNRTETVDESLCNQKDKPEQVIKECSAEACFSYRDDEMYDWGPCSVTCGEGVQEKEQLCIRKEHGVDIEVDAEFCEKANLTLPTRPCAEKPCGYLEWGAGPWSMCSRTCGPGQKKRIIYCGDPYQSSEPSMCPGKPPEEYQDCEDEPCTGQSASCVADRANFCDRANGFLCSHPAYFKVCCVSCSNVNDKQPENVPWNRRRHRRYHG